MRLTHHVSLPDRPGSDVVTTSNHTARSNNVRGVQLGGHMHRLKVEAEIVIFLLFFGTAMVDALRRHSWLMSSVYILLGLMFLFSGRSRRSDEAQTPR